MADDSQVSFGRRDTSALLGDSFRIYWRNFLKLVGITLLPVLPVTCLALGFIAYTFRAFYITFAPMPYEMLDDPRWIAFAVCLYLLILLATLVANAALIHAIAQRELLGSMSIKQAYRSVFRRFWPLLGASILRGLAVLLLAVSIIGYPAGIYFEVRWNFIWQTVMLENKEVTASFSRSSQVVKEHWWFTLGMELLWGLILGAIIAVTEMLLSVVAVLGLVIGDSAESITGAIIAIAAAYAVILLIWILIYPLQLIFPTLLFFDLRARR